MNFRGTSVQQDAKFSDKERKLLKSMSFPPSFDTKVDMKKVNLDVIRAWISDRVMQLLGFEDDVLVDFCYSLLEEENPDPRKMQINLTGFLETKTPVFMQELWELLVSAQETIGGIPKSMLEMKKKEIQAKREERERIAAALREKEEKNVQEKDFYGRNIVRRLESPVRRERRREYSRSRSRSPHPRERRRERSYSRSRSPPRRMRWESPYRGRMRSRSPPRHRSRTPDSQSRSRSGTPPRRRSRTPPRFRRRSPSVSRSRSRSRSRSISRGPHRGRAMNRSPPRNRSRSRSASSRSSYSSRNTR